MLAAMRGLAASLRHASRRLLAAPGFSATVVLTLAVGVGATTALFTSVNAILLRPLPYPDSARLMSVSHAVAIAGMSQVDQSDATFLYYRRENKAFTDMGAYRSASVNLGAVSGGGADAGAPERVLAGRVSAGLVTVLGVPPLVGRDFTDLEDRVDGPGAVLIGERLWRRRYGADPGVLGRSIDIDGIAREVVGIMPETFHFPSAETALWIPLRLDPGATDSASFDYKAIGRLRDGISAAAAAADLQGALPRVPEAFPGRLTTASIEQIRMRTVVRPLRDVVLGDIDTVLWVLLGAAFLVLAATCANAGNMALARADGRGHELAVRRALGAGRGAVALDIAAEGMVLASLGGVAGVGVAALAIRALHATGGGLGIARLPEVHVDGATLAAAATATATAIVFVGALPAWRALRGLRQSALADTSRSVTAGRRRHRVRYALVAGQVALSLVLLAGSGLMARTFIKLRAVEPGIEPAGALVFRTALPEARYGRPAAAARFLIAAVDEIAALPGVASAGIVSKLPLDPVGKLDTAVFVEDRPPSPGDIPGIHDVAYVTPGYFAAVGLPILDGRTLEAPDPGRAPREVVVTRQFARRYWPHESAIGKRVRILLNGPWFTVVGVTGAVHNTSLTQAPDETIYCSIVTAEADTRWAPRDVAFVVRATGDAASLAAPARAVLRQADPGVPIYGARPMDVVVSRASARTAFVFMLLVAAAAVALLLGATGIYGTMSYVVSLRKREIGVRLALGARPGDVRLMIARHAALVVACGMLAGLSGAAALTRVLSTLLFDVSATDPAVFTAAAAVLASVALAASWIPALRASRVDPATTLRAE